MKYIVIEVQKFADGGMSTPAYAYDTQNSAEAKYHSILSSAAISTLPVHSAILITEEGFPIDYKCYKHEET